MSATTEEAVGYEPSPVAAEMARIACHGTRVEVVQATIDQIDRHFEVALCLDVFEHVDDYIGFIRQLRPIADVVVFHIPLDISVQAVARGAGFGRMREIVGHLHYFTADTALATLEHCGYHIVGHDYTGSSFEGPGRSRRQHLAGHPAWLWFSWVVPSVSDSSAASPSSSLPVPNGELAPPRRDSTSLRLDSGQTETVTSGSMAPRRGGGPASRRWALRMLLAAGALTAPWSAAILGAGVVRFRVSDALLGVALATTVLYRLPGRRGALYLPRPARSALMGVGMLCLGILLGTWVGPGGDAVILVGFVVAAAVPIILLTRIRATAGTLRLAAKAFVLGVCISVLATMAAGYRNASGAAVGFTLHRNQLGMTIAMALPLVGLLDRRWQRLAAYGVLLTGINLTGSRSTFLGVLVVGAVMTALWLRPRPSRTIQVMVVLVALAVPIAFVVDSGSFVSEQSTLRRLAGTENARTSDLQRSEALETSFGSLDLGTGLLGGGYFLDPPPHSMPLETLLAGGGGSGSPACWWCCAHPSHRWHDSGSNGGGHGRHPTRRGTAWLCSHGS